TMPLLFCLLFSLLSPSRSSFHPAFESFLVNNYGTSIASSLSRRDLGEKGSYGGMDSQGLTRSRQQSVVLVHGITNSAGTFSHVRDIWRVTDMRKVPSTVQLKEMRGKRM
ncbi:hypothetical protein PFISCL1PPCAC_6235, partial [Pristionchus fissidentatus]